MLHSRQLKHHCEGLSVLWRIYNQNEEAPGIEHVADTQEQEIKPDTTEQVMTCDTRREKETYKA